MNDHRGTHPKGIQANDIVTGYGQREVVHEVSIESCQGVTCIFGPNGSGKSTLMKALSGKLPIWSGALFYGGEDITNESITDIYKRGIIQLPQDGGLFPTLTVYENLQLGGLKASDIDERIAKIFDRFPMLAEKRTQRARELSGGQRMLLSMARAMIAEPSIYLLDEPSAGLSPALVDSLFDIVRDIVDSGAHVILIEQNVRSALRIADFVYILSQGRTQFEGTPHELGEHEDLLETYLGIS